jgi:hypothetical protein
MFMVCLMVLSQPLGAQGIKERMIARIPVIADLKTKGIIGEDNRGYLGFVTAQRVEEALVAAENTDRRMVYEHFAKQQNTTLAVVEKIQANRKAEKANPGEFFQNPAGAWVKK